MNKYKCLICGIIHEGHEWDEATEKEMDLMCSIDESTPEYVHVCPSCGYIGIINEDIEIV